MNGFFVTGTDTDVGKTLVSAWLLTHLDAWYWKPVQAGTLPETDSATVRRLAEVAPERILPEAYVLPEPTAPHEAARRAGIEISMAKITPPVTDRLLVVEGAGGALVPLTDTAYVIDLATELHLPVILVARSTLGTINHTLLSLEAIRRRGVQEAVGSLAARHQQPGPQVIVGERAIEGGGERRRVTRAGRAGRRRRDGRPRR